MNLTDIITQEDNGSFTLTAPSNHEIVKQIKVILICHNVAKELADNDCVSFSEQLGYWLKAFDMLALSNLNKIIISGQMGNETAQRIEMAAQAINDIGDVGL